MSSHARLSPRAAVRTWLASTEEPANSIETGLSKPHNAENTRKSSGRRRVREPGDTCGLDPITTNDKSRQEKLENRSRARQNGLAERLGLHAPFRTFPDHGKDDHLEKHNPSDSRKRGRRLSSSSALEPAGGHLGRNHSHGEARHKEGSANHYERRRPSSRLDHEAADSASDAASSSKKPPKSYERRPRHKTKGDKYTVKKPSTKAEKRKRKKGETSGARKQNKKRKRKERSGDALLHTFSAPNVTQDRLTMRTTAPMGLFGKGRASSPVRRRGLPDLTFSEAKFLNSSRSKQDAAAQRAPEKKRRRRDKIVGAEEDMSRYFTAKRTEQEGYVARSDQDTRTATIAHSMLQDLDDSNRLRTASSLPPVELPDRPFLGFGSSGVSLPSPVKGADHRDALCGSASSGKPRLSTRSSIDSSSYYTWSDSPSSKPNHHDIIDGTRAEFRCDVQKKLKPRSSSLIQSPSGQKDNAHDEVIEASDYDPNEKSKLPEDDPLTPKATLSIDFNPVNEAPAEEHSYGISTVQPDVLRETIVAKDNSRRETRQKDNAEPTKIGSVLVDCTWHLTSTPAPKSKNLYGFPLSFDRTLESLLEACSLPSHQSKDPLNLSTASRSGDQAQCCGDVEVRLNPENASNYDQRHAIPPHRVRDHARNSRRESDLQFPTAPLDNIYYTTRALQHSDEVHNATKASYSDSEIGLPHHVSLGLPSRHEPVMQAQLSWHNNLNPNKAQGILLSGAWHGYQNIYEGQLNLDDEARRYDSHIHPAEYYNCEGGETVHSYEDGLKRVPESGTPDDDHQDNTFDTRRDIENKRDTYDEGIYWDPGTIPYNDEFNQPQPLDIGRQTNDMTANLYVPVSISPSTEQRETPLENSDSLEAQDWSMSTVYSRNSPYPDVLNEYQQLNQNDTDEAHLAGFWRPNKLY